MILKGPEGEQYTTGKEIGRGGEGTVYEVQSNNGLVLKRYNDPLTPAQTSKLQQMVAMRNPAIEAYAAWPRGLVLDDTGAVCGFVMKKLVGFVPLHMIFSPMDRKKMFPDKGYNFLVHVARNLATAFHKLHESGLVVGDVNEGNILISAAGMISFIDCDSFQVKGKDTYYFCEVGVPRYTPPELLKEGTFEQIVRTVNTDSFSLAVLIFQLLFLGRHPFAGRNKTSKDIDEETAIRNREFAYSLQNTKKKLSPPNDSFSITNLSDDLVALFHQAFEQDARPAPGAWVRALDGLLGDMVTCGISRLHTYPSKLQECPWCKFRETRGILYFLDDSYLKSNALLDDIETFVNGFRIDRLELKKWTGSAKLPELAAYPIAKKYQNYKAWRKWGSIAVFLFGLVAFFINGPFLILPEAIFVIAMVFFINTITPWAYNTKAQLNYLKLEVEKANEQLQRSVFDYDNAADATGYLAAVSGLDKLVQDFRNLPEEFDRLKKAMEESIYDEQLHFYLNIFDIEQHNIPQIGSVKKKALMDNGIRTAADITRLSAVKVPGIGLKNQQILLSWQRQMSSGFVYIPDNERLSKGMDQVKVDVDNIKLKLESDIRKSYQSITYLKLNITNRALVLERQINDLSVKKSQAELDYRAFEKFAKVWPF